MWEFDTIRDMLWVNGDEGDGGWVNEVRRVGEEEGWGMPNSAVNVLTGDMDLIPKKVWATMSQRYLFSLTFKPITTACRQVTMNGIACTTERVERRVNTNIVDRVGIRLIKTIVGGEFGSKVWSGNINW